MEGGGGNKKSEKQLREPRSEKEEQKEMTMFPASPRRTYTRDDFPDRNCKPWRAHTGAEEKYE